MLRRVVNAGCLALSVLAVSSCAAPPPQQRAPQGLQTIERPARNESSSVSIPTSAPLIGPAPGESKNINLPSGRTFILHLPADYSPAQKWPVIFGFHGWKENAAGMERYTQLDAAQAIVVYPQGVAGAWAPAPYAQTTGEQDLDFVRNIVDSLRATYAVDDSRIFAAGMSNGGGFAVYLSCRLPEVFSSVASVSAAYYDKIYDSCENSEIARLDIHGTNDPIVSYYGGIRHETPYRSVDEVLERDHERNGCSESIDTTRLSSTSLRMRWVDCSSPLVHIRIGGGSHVWPGGSYDKSAELPKGFATDAVLDFFGVPGRPHEVEAS